MLVAPATAFAQGAGDQQYQDPLGATGGGSGSGSGSAGTSRASSPSPSPAPSPSSSSPTRTNVASSSHRARAAASSGELPRTGGEPFIVAYLGAAMLAIGAGMRLAVPRRR